jgi:hypothetical protein
MPAEITEFQRRVFCWGGQEDVFGFEVAVDYAHLMQVLYL